VNDAVRVPTDGLLTTAELAARPDFTLGLTVISPSSRTIAGPGGTADVEPRVMQVLVVLADAAGQVVTRGTLFDRCWGGVYVGDDSLNRTIGAIRKLAAEIGGGSFEIETIPRTGYRLSGANGAPLAELCGGEASHSRGVSRRQLAIGSGAAAAVLATGGGIWWWRTRFDPRFQRLIDYAEDAVRHENLDEKTVQILQQALAIRPDSAKAWGLLALVRSVLAQNADPRQASGLVDEAEKTARRALSLDPEDPNALLAMFELQGASLDWITRDQRLRQIIAIDPNNVGAILELTLLTAAAGLTGESWGWNERALALEPLSFDFLSKRALKLWIAGRVNDADKVIDQVRGLYPQQPWPWWVRFLTFALTGRARAAQAMLDEEPQMLGSAAEARLWRDCLPALDAPSPKTIGKARNSCIEGGRLSGSITSQAALIMCALGDVDTAYEIADALLFSRGPIVRRPRQGSRGAVEDAGWRVNTQWMWTPPAAAMRADGRFLPLCKDVGLVDYWGRRGVKPNLLRSGS
jgi:DNA-binding winged helix-turn-helix (wHTH) protein